MLNRNDIAALIPHQGAMCLLEQVVSWDATRICCSTSSHRNPHHPLRMASGLPAACAIEYAAQAIAVHGGLQRAQNAEFRAPSAGYLANAREVTWAVQRLDDIEGDLLIDAEQLISEGGRSIYAFTVSANGRALIQGRVAVALEGAAS
jgi:predicted hotdog family 3-hydroxylacyl-ACP dehydratase